MAHMNLFCATSHNIVLALELGVGRGGRSMIVGAGTVSLQHWLTLCDPNNHVAVILPQDLVMHATAAAAASTTAAVACTVHKHRVHKNGCSLYLAEARSSSLVVVALPLHVNNPI